MKIKLTIVVRENIENFFIIFFLKFKNNYVFKSALLLKRRKNIVEEISSSAQIIFKFNFFFDTKNYFNSKSVEYFKKIKNYS